jgi:phosphoribosylformimino-5-aminoimidazole carboxamide ribotide isomerase
MLIIPAVDIREGKVVRLLKGDFGKEKVYSKDPVSVALEWQRQGARFLHIVDLDGARCGELKNLPIIEEIAGRIDIPFEVGGGIRQEEAISQLIDIGVSRVVLGTAAFEDRVFLERVVEKYKDKIVVSVDITADDKIALRGWIENGGKGHSPISFIKAIYRIGIRRIIYTDIERDGTLSGPRYTLLLNYLTWLRQDNVDISVIVAGGISSLVDIRYLMTYESLGLEGVIVGKALYENRFSLQQAQGISSRRERA